MKKCRKLLAIAALTMGMASPARAQHDHQSPPAATASPWTFMQDGVVFGLHNNQGGPRGGDECVNRAHETTRHAVFGEATRRFGKTALFERAEAVQVETEKLLHGDSHSHDDAGLKDTVGALTFGALRDVGAWRGFEGGLGASVTFYGVPDRLRPTHGDRPVSFQIFFRLRTPAGAMGRMWDMRMSRPMPGHIH